MTEHQTLPDHLDRFRLGVYCADFSESYSFIRVAGPFETMAAEDRRLEIIRPPRAANGDQQLNWDWLLQCDAIFMFHPFFDQHLHCLATARKLGKPVWVEYVDDMFSVPAHSPHYQMFKDRRLVRDQTTSALDLASVVTVTSQLLKDALVKACDLDSTVRPSRVPQPTAVPSDKILVIPEAVLFSPAQRPRRKCVTWRGLATHDEDVAGVLRPLCKVAADFPDWEWVLFGQPSREMQEQLIKAAGRKKVHISPLWPTPLDLHEAWGGVAPYLHLAPLADTPFNRSKSHLAFLEATAIGAGVIVPDHLPEWQQPGVIPYYSGDLVFNGKTNFEDTLRRELLSWPEVGSQRPAGNFHPSVQTARQFVYPERTLTAMNQRRWAIIRALAESRVPLPASRGEPNLEVVA